MSVRNKFLSAKIGGEEREFYVGMNTWHEVCQVLKIEAWEIIDAFSRDPYAYTRALYYASMVAACEMRGKNVEFTLAQVGDWIEDADAEQLKQIGDHLSSTESLGKFLALAAQGMKSNQSLKKQIQVLVGQKLYGLPSENSGLSPQSSGQ